MKIITCVEVCSAIFSLTMEYSGCLEKVSHALSIGSDKQLINDLYHKIWLLYETEEKKFKTIDYSYITSGCLQRCFEAEFCVPLHAKGLVPIR